MHESLTGGVEGGDSKDESSGFEAKVARNLESGPEQGMERQPQDERLPEEEALLYQEYATKKGGVGWEVRADEASYAEAEQLIQQLRNQRFNFLGIRWDQVDLNNVVAREDVTERLRAAVVELAQKQGRPIPKVGTSGQKGSVLLAALCAALISLVPEHAVEASQGYIERDKATTAIKSPTPVFFSPHWETDKQGNFKWGNLGKMILEPLAINGVFRSGEKKNVEINVPYEYARLFDAGKPLDTGDYDKLNKYIEKELLRQFTEGAYAFSWDKEALAKRNPQALEVKDIKIKNVQVLGAASPEARTKESLLSGNIDPENEKLALLRASHAKDSLSAILQKMGVNHDQQDFTIDGVEEQFSVAEEKALEALADKYALEPFELVKRYNGGMITDPDDARALDQLIAAKRQVTITFEREGEAPKGIIIPLPLLLLLLLRRRRGERGANQEAGQRPVRPAPADYWMTVPRLRTQWRELPWRIPLPQFRTRAVPMTLPVPVPTIAWREWLLQLPLPKLKVDWRDIKIERFAWKTMEDTELEQRKLNVYIDIAQNFDLYEAAARRYTGVNLADEEESVGRITSHVLVMWEDMDNKKRQEAGVEGKVDYFSNDHQKLYAELHAVVVRRLARDMQKGQFVSFQMSERRHQIEAIIEEEFARYKK